MLESNGHSPVATREEFMQNFVAAGDELQADWKSAHPRAPLTLSGFVDAMNASGSWTPVPLFCAMAGASGPVDQDFFDEVVEEHEKRLRAALPVDGVFLALHGGSSGTGEADPEGVLLERVRAIVGHSVPIVAPLDLHANVSRKMVDNANALVAYRTNPHVDMAERGAECAALLREMLSGVDTASAFVKLPFIPPSVAQNTKSGPYADIIAYGQSKIDKRVMNVSVVSGFSLGDSVKNGMSVIVTTRGDKALAEKLARDIAQKTWDDRHRYEPRLTSLEDATRMALECGRDPSKPALLFADVADNPGGGGRGNTMHILAAFLAAGVEGCLMGVIHDPLLAEEAHRLGVGARFTARFNRPQGTLTANDEFSRPLEAEAEVVALSDGRVTGRRGIFAGTAMTLGATAALRLGGITVVVISIRTQCADPAFLEHLGLDIGAARCVVVKSRGHFRGGFDEFFTPDRIVEVDAPGLTSPILTRFAWTKLPRPVLPIDPDAHWSPAR
jgi:microcystin degradation protein MlrC